MITPCIDTGACEYANSRPNNKNKNYNHIHVSTEANIWIINLLFLIANFTMLQYPPDKKKD